MPLEIAGISGYSQSKEHLHVEYFSIYNISIHIVAFLEGDAPTRYPPFTILHSFLHIFLTREENWRILRKPSWHERENLKSMARAMIAR